MKGLFRDLDYQLLAIILLLSSFGLVMVYSSSFAFSILEYGSGTHFFYRQLLWLIVSFLLFLFVSKIPYQIYGKWAPVLIGIVLFFLILILIPGVGLERNHSTRWLGVGPLIFQPSELVKIVMMIFFAKVYTNKQHYIRDFKKGLLPPLVILAMMIGLILLQPDLGTSISIMLGCAGILLVSGARWLHIGILGLIGTAGVTFLAITESYRMERLVSYMNPFADAEDEGFQLVNSYLAIGDGGLLGHGLGNSVQKLGYLPEAHTDFIMAIISEELGVFGVFFVVGLFTWLVFKGYSIYKHATDRMGRLLAFGITTQIATQAMLNLGAVSGLLPITGIPLPLVSYGGTSIVMTMISLAILMNISRQTNERIRHGEEQTDPSKTTLYMRRSVI